MNGWLSASTSTASVVFKPAQRRKAPRGPSHKGRIATMTNTTIITITPAARPGQFEARCSGRVLCTSRQPHLDGARALLELGYSPLTIIVTRRGDVDCLRSTIAAAARLTIKEKVG